ncbi:MAG: ATP-binding protein [Candidatus Margulisbacteria bacterium]|nr:ATP-binding protein [Candidatus Margulisiibacteriota bacterium]
MERALKIPILEDLPKKIVMISGPRQCGKTTLAKMLSTNYDYLNFDEAEHRVLLQEKSWDRKKDLVIFDEIHKMKKWKSWLKGIYDVEGLKPKIVVTGSARLDTIKKVGDSLAGRYFLYRLHPLNIKEAVNMLKLDPDEILERLLKVGGFPEPFLENSINYYNRWKKTHLDIILRQDLIDLESVSDIKSIETLIELLRSRVGSPISYASLARDLEKNSKTIKRWLILLENLFVIFPVRPLHKNVARAILKEPKYYFYDIGQVKGEEGARLENLVACALRKELDYLEDVKGMETGLYYVKNKEGKELDFAVKINEQTTRLIEVKLTDSGLSKNFIVFQKHFKNAKTIQLVKNITREKTFPDGAEIRKISNYLAKIDFSI